jgi:NADP-dependent 3-hydroxy acid dehydrogenase YdfG
MQGALQNRAVLITGGGSGIGAATCRELARAGARVAILGRRQALLDEVAAEVTAAGGTCMVIAGDVRDYSQVERAVNAVVERLGGLDVLVANAAMVDHGPIDQADPARWADLIATNVLGVMFAVRAALPTMYRSGHGHVLVVASASGRVTYVGEPAYVTSKHAVVAFADCLRKETAARGVRVTVLEPGLVDTPFIDWEAVREHVPGVTPLEPEDCARVIRFALEQPPNVALNEIVIRPADQQL